MQEDEEDEWDFGIINGPRPREIPLPARVTGITEAAWLTGDRVLLSVPEQGLLKFNVATGELAPVWELPEGDLPCRPEVRLLPLPDTFSDEAPEKYGRGPD